MRTKDHILLESAYLQVIEEGRKQRYMEMFKKLISSADNLPSEERTRLNNDTEHIVAKAVESLKKENIIVWFLKLYRKDLAYIIKNHGSDLPKFTDSYYTYSTYALEYLEKLKHFLSLPIAEIQNYDYSKLPTELEKESLFVIVADVLNEFRGYEVKWIERQKQWIDITDELREGTITPIVVFDDDYRWFNLNVPKSEKEGKAMGHCGNCGGRTDDTILSFRKLKKESGRILARPSLTFILGSDGLLGEMKGRANKKPKEIYHPYILRLLGLKNLIRGIKGGGYLPQRNFSIVDLSEKRIDDLFKERPDFGIFGDESTNVAGYIADNRKKFPKSVLKSLEPYDSYSFAVEFIRQNKKIPDTILDSIAKSPIYSYDVIIKLLYDYKPIPKKLLLGVSKSPDSSYKLAEYILKTRNYEMEKFGGVPEIIINSIASDTDASEKLKDYVHHRIVDEYFKNKAITDRYINILAKLPNGTDKLRKHTHLLEILKAHQLEKLKLPIVYSSRYFYD